VDRNKQLEEVRDVYMHVEKETDAGLIVSGAKVVATTSSLTHYNFIANNGALPIKTKDFAFVCIVPTDAPGVKLFCRPSYELAAAATGSPFDYPLSSRLDENDSIIVFDKVFVPFENVFATAISTGQQLLPRSGFCRASCFTAAYAWPSSSISSRACCSRPSTPPAPRIFAACRLKWAKSWRGATCSGR
jgi:4-hydroxyphenylacetate 3-monooxygenase